MKSTRTTIDSVSEAVPERASAGTTRRPPRPAPAPPERLPRREPATQNARPPARLAAALLLAVAAHLAAAVPAAAQRGALRGTLIDPDGNPVPAVQVSIVLADGGGRPITVETNDEGRFARAALRVGTYRVTMERDGWEPLQAIVNISSGSQAFIEETFRPLPEGVLSVSEAQQAEIHLQEAQSGFESGDWQTAVSGFLAFIQFQPNSAGAYFNLGASYERMDDYASAILAYEQAVDLDPSLGHALLAVAGLQGRQQQWNEALATFDRVPELVESSAMMLYNYATYAANAQRIDLAVEFYEKAANADPQLAIAHFQAGLMKYQAGDPEGAADFLDRYLDLELTGPQADAALQVLAAARPADAVAYYGKRLEANPADSASRFRMGWVQHQSGDLEGAGETLLAYLEEDPEGEHVEEALASLENAVPASAVRYWQQQTDADPQNAEAFFRLGAVLYRTEDFAGAVAAFERHLELAPDSENADSAREQLADAQGRL